MTYTRPIKELPADQIKAVLASGQDDLTDHQILAIKEFVDEIGGIENALMAVKLLCELEDAA